MTQPQIAQTRIQELEQLLAEAQADSEKSRAAHMQARDEMLTARNTFLRCKQGWRLQLNNTLGTEVAEVSEGIQLLMEQRDAADSKARKMARTADELARINERLDQLIVDLRRTQFRTFADEECWIWQGDGSDNLDTLVCPVVISAGDLKGLISERDRLLDGYPEGMTPADVIKLKRYNAELAQENHELKIARDAFKAQRDANAKQNARLRGALEYSNSYLNAGPLNTIGYQSKAHMEMIDALEWPATRMPEHADDIAVDHTAAAMKAKLAKKRDEGYGGWDDANIPVQHLAKCLVDHIAKGDPIDIANFAMMLHNRDAEPAVLTNALAEIRALAFDSPAIHPRMKAGCIGEFSVDVEHVCPECWHSRNEACEICNGESDESGLYPAEVDVPWTTQKEIFKAMCTFKAAALREEHQA